MHALHVFDIYLDCRIIDGIIWNYNNWDRQCKFPKDVTCILFLIEWNRWLFRIDISEHEAEIRSDILRQSSMSL